MAEIAFMLRLYRLTQAIYQVHPFGVDVVVLTDGDLYHEFFGIEECDVTRYHKKLLNYRNKLNLQATVSFISLKEMIDRADETGIAHRITSHIEERLVAIVSEGASEKIRVAFSILKQGMKWNCNSKNNRIPVDDPACWSILCSSVDKVDRSIQKMWKDFDDEAFRIAIRYAAVNLMLKKTSLIQMFFPEAIRGTVHPKKNQFALAGNSSYAWNGVAWSDTWPKNIDYIKVRPYMDLPNSKPLNLVVLEHTHEPLFYTNADPLKNIHGAKKAFPTTQRFKVSDMVLRPFKPSDLTELESLGRNDEGFTWDRVSQDGDYYKSLIDFRLKHYSTHGFGVYGVWRNETFIGQVGLQVIESEVDQVEWVMFLGKNHANQGLGTLLLRYIIGLCRHNGMDTLYAIVRPDNEAGIAITKKFGGVQINKVVHYSENGVKFKLDLTRVV